MILIIYILSKNIIYSPSLRENTPSVPTTSVEPPSEESTISSQTPEPSRQSTRRVSSQKLSTPSNNSIRRDSEKTKEQEREEREERKKKLLEDEKQKRAALLQLRRTKELREAEEQKKIMEEVEARKLQLLEDAAKKKLDEEMKRREGIERKRLEEIEAKRLEEEERIRNTAINVALKAKVWCSGVFDPMGNGEFEPENCVDGNPETRWCGHPPESAWIVVDWGELKDIVKVRIRFERAFAQDYRVEFAEDVQDFEKHWKSAEERYETNRKTNLTSFIELMESKVGMNLSIIVLMQDT